MPWSYSEHHTYKMDELCLYEFSADKGNFLPSLEMVFELPMPAMLVAVVEECSHIPISA
jgi:hypothetical protein